MNEPLEVTGKVGLWIHLGHADNIFFPNVRERLKILAILPLESTEVESSFSFIRRIHTWLRNEITAERPSDLAVIAGHLCKCSYHRRPCFWPTRLVGYFFALYFFYFVAFQEFIYNVTVSKSPLLSATPHQKILDPPWKLTGALRKNKKRKLGND